MKPYDVFRVRDTKGDEYFIKAKTIVLATERYQRATGRGESFILSIDRVDTDSTFFILDWPEGE